MHLHTRKLIWKKGMNLDIEMKVSVINEEKNRIAEKRKNERVIFSPLVL